MVSREEFDALKLKLERVTEQLDQVTLQLAQFQGIVQALQPPPSPAVIRLSSYSYYRLTPITRSLPAFEQVSDEEALKELHTVKEELALGPIEAKISETAWLERFLHAAAQGDVPTRNKLFLAFAKDFIRHASTRARIILQEINLPTHKKSILPLHVGGAAGGTKYLDDNILFKFADDPRIDGGQHLYGGSDPDFERAAKAAANDLKGSNSYFQCLTLFGRLSVIVPPEVLLDFNGFRLIAIPWLPLGSGKLVYGSADQGRTVYDDDPKIRAALKFAAHHLHLAAHRVKNQLLFTAGDVEGHQDMEGRYYLVDLARAFPPEDPTISKHLQQPESCVFFRFHRAEFMAWLKNRGSSPLSPDAFSMWGQLDAHIHNRQVQLATEELINVRVPELVTWLCSLELVPTNLGKVLQQWGISVRHLGLVRALVRQRSQAQQYKQLDLNILACIVQRCCKNLLRQDLRAAALSRNVNDTIASFLNDLVHQSTEESFSFWTVRVPKDIRSRFGSIAITEEEGSKLARICESQIPSIAKYVCMRLGISLAHEWHQRFSRDSVLSTSVRAKTFGVLESLLHEDSVEMACESQTSTEFTMAVTRLAQTASDELGYLIRHIDDLDKVRQIFSTHCDSLTVKNVNLARLAALALHFRGESLAIADMSDQWMLALAPRLPHIFSRRQLDSMMTERLSCLCREQKTQISPNVHALVVALVEARADPNARDDEGDPLLFKCIIAGNESMADSLLECHASYDGIKDGFGKLLDEVVTSYYLEGTPQYLIRQNIFLKGLVGPPPHELPPVRLRVHSLLITQLPEGLDISLLRFRVKLRGGGHKAQQKAHMNFAGHAFFVRQEFFFEHWPDVEDLKCVVTHGTDVLATVKLQRPSQVYSPVHARMTAHAPRPSPPASASTFSCNTSPPSSNTSLSSSTSSCLSPASSCSSGSSSRRSYPASISPFTLVADIMYVAPEAKLVSLSSSNMAYFHPKHPPQNSILLLGAPRSGKTTLFKRLCCVPFSADQRLYYGEIVRRNVIHGVKGLIQGVRARLYDTLPENANSIRFVEEIDEHAFDAAEVVLHLANTLNDPGIKKTLATSSQYSLDRFFTNVVRIFAADHMPSDEDVFGCYEPTHLLNEGVTENEWTVSDAGGSKLEQKKWFLLYPHASCIFFTVNLCSEFEEGDIMNGMAESFALWESVVSHPALNSIPFMLIFTFDTEFRRKLAESALRGGQSGSYEDATQSLSKQFGMGNPRVRVFFIDLLNETCYANMLREIELTLSSQE